MRIVGCDLHAKMLKYLWTAARMQGELGGLARSAADHLIIAITRAHLFGPSSEGARNARYLLHIDPRKRFYVWLSGVR